MTDKLTDASQTDTNELVSRVKSSVPGSFEELSERFSGMIHKILSGLGFPPSEKDDLFQEGLIGLYKAAMLYEPELSSFSTFAYVCIRHGILSALRKMPSQAVESGYEEALSLSDTTSPESIFLGKESHAALLERIDGLLSKYESCILKYYLSGLPHSEIARLVGRNVKSVDNAIARIKHKLSRSLL